MNHATHIVNNFMDLYYWAVETFGTPRNMLFKTGEERSTWTVVRDGYGHKFVFDKIEDNITFAQHVVEKWGTA